MRFCFAVALMTISVAAQTPPGGRMGRPAERWLSPLSAAERNPRELRAGLTRASVHRAAPVDWLAQGQWSRTAEGRAIYRVALRSPEAIGLRLHFRNFQVGDGRVWLYPADGVTDGYFAGPYSARGVFGDGEFWSEFIEGESVVLEYESSRGGRLPFDVDVVSHVFHEVVPGTGKASTRREALSCNKDATCYPEWAERARSVGRYLFETNGGGALCSGSLIKTRNSSGIPYFLTADHCVNNAAEARSVQVFWGYTSVACGGAPKNLRSLPTTLGSTYLVGGGLEQGDFTLLRLNSAPPNTATFSGWTSEEHPVGGGVTGIHHPGGDYQRISFGARGDAVPVRGRPEPFFYTINWREGITEGGSSGSPLFNADGLIVGMLSAGPKPPAGKTECDLNPAFDWYGRFSTAYPALQAFLEERTTGGGTTPPPPPPPAGGGTTLTNNTAARFQFAAVDGPTFLGSTGTYRVDVPQGATRLEIRVRTTTPNADVDLFVRAGTAPELNGSSVVSDYSGETESGNETVVITPTSNPPLRAGAYFATLAVFTPGVAVEGTITAVITAGGGGGTPSTGAQTLTSGQSRIVTIEPVPNAVLLGGADSYQINVPAGSTRLEIRLETDNRAVDLDLFARFGDAVTIANGSAVADHRSEGPDGNESIVITPTSSPALRPGTYFIHLGVFTTNTRIISRLTATVSGGGSTPPPAGQGGTLSSGVPVAYSVGPVASASIVGGGYQISVPAGTTRLEVRVRTTTPGADVDLYVREGSAPSVSGGSVVADFRSESDSGDETIIITPQSTPPLRSGTYFIALGLFTPNVRVQGTLTATLTTATGGNAVAQPLLVGVQQAFRLAAVSNPALINDPSFRVTVPQGATRMRIEVRTTTPRADVDLFVRYEQAPVVSSGSILSDYQSTGDTGDENLDIRPSSTPPLRAGTYYINLALFTTGTDVQGSITVFIDSVPPPRMAVELSSGVAAPFTYAAVPQPTLYSGDSGFRIAVPQGATSMTVRLNTATPNADLDLYIRRGADVELAGDNLVADYFSEGSTGNEVITITRTSNPPLEPGVYFIALGNFARNVQVSGSVTATIERATSGPATGQTRVLSLNDSVRYELGPVDTPTLFAGSNTIRLDVANVSKMEIVLTTDQEGVDTDLYVRYGAPPVVQNGNVVADFRSAGVGGSERVTIQPGANSPLRTGSYYIAVGLFSTGVRATGTVSASDQSANDLPKQMRLERFEKSAWPVDGLPLLKEKRKWRE